MRFSFSTPSEIARGMKRIWDSKMGTPSSARIIEDVDLELKVSVGEVHRPKVRGASLNAPKRCSCTVIC